MKFWYLFLGVVIGLSSYSSASYLNWEVIETDHYRLYFDHDHKGQAIDALNELELNRPLVTRIVGNEPKKFSIVLEDLGQTSNGSATVFPERMTLWTYMPSPYGFTTNQHSYMRSLTTHELTHMAHMTSVSGNVEKYVHYFGSPFYLNVYTPSWFLEGLAVYVESQNSPYEGRLNDARTHAFFKSAGKNYRSIRIDAMTLPGNTYVGRNTPYLYGGRFIQYLAQTYGENCLAYFISEYGKEFRAPLSVVAPSLGLDITAKKIFKKSFSALVDEWQQNEIKTAQNFIQNGTLITHTGWDKTFLESINNKLYYTDTRLRHIYPLTYLPLTQVMVWDPETKLSECLYSSDRPITLPITVLDNSLYFTHPNLKEGFENIIADGFGEIQTLYKMNLKNKGIYDVFSDNITAFTVSDDDSVIYISRKNDGYSSYLKLYRHSTTRVLGEVPLCISEIKQFDGDYYVIGKTKFEAWNLYRINSKTFELTKLMNSSFAIYAMHFQNDGIIFSCDKDYERQTYKFYFKTQLIDKISNGNDAGKGVVLGDKLYCTLLHENGEDIAEQPISLSRASGFLSNISGYSPSYEFNPKSDPDAVFKSNEGLIKPHTRLVFLNLGEDDLGLLKYSLTYSPFSGVGLSAEAHHFRPMTIGFQSALNKNLIFVSYPAFKSHEAGVRSISFLGLLDQDRTGYVGTVVGYQDTHQSGGVSALGSPTKKSYRLNWQQLIYAHDFTAKFRFSGVENENQYDVLRGFRYVLVEDRKGFNTSADLLYRIHTLPSGSWPIAVGYEGDVFLGAFYDYSNFSKQNAEGIYGQIGTLWTLYNLGLNFSYGVAFSNGESAPFITLEFALGF